MVPIRAPSRAASARSAELRIDRAPTYDRRDTNKASLSGSRVAPELIKGVFVLALGITTTFACDSGPAVMLLDVYLACASPLMSAGVIDIANRHLSSLKRGHCDVERGKSDFMEILGALGQGQTTNRHPMIGSHHVSDSKKRFLANCTRQVKTQQSPVVNG